MTKEAWWDDLPETITVDERELRVELRDRIGDLDAGGHEIGGMYVARRNLILINGRVSRDAAKHTLLHELGHHAFERDGLNKRYSQAAEERTVAGITYWLHQALKDEGLRAFLEE